MMSKKDIYSKGYFLHEKHKANQNLQRKERKQRRKIKELVVLSIELVNDECFQNLIAMKLSLRFVWCNLLRGVMPRNLKCDA